jgi:hypothetical protein
VKIADTELDFRAEILISLPLFISVLIVGLFQRDIIVTMWAFIVTIFLYIRATTTHQQNEQQYAQPQQQVHHQQFQGQQQRVLHNDVQHEREHMKEHMEVPIDTSNMSEQELQFHYFKMHDTDNNNKLDGCELVKSLIHWHGESPKYMLHGMIEDVHDINKFNAQHAD